MTSGSRPPGARLECYRKYSNIVPTSARPQLSQTLQNSMTRNARSGCLVQLGCKTGNVELSRSGRRDCYDGRPGGRSGGVRLRSRVLPGGDSLPQTLRQSPDVRWEPACGPICSMPPSTAQEAPVT